MPDFFMPEYRNSPARQLAVSCHLNMSGNDLRWIGKILAFWTAF
ncbi:hypothetical protein [Vibrio hangzhouensis]|nr:hypothetical protein [Vibrio hangzhouensis]